MKTEQPQMYTILRLGESYTNKTTEVKDIQVSYINVFGLRQTSFRQIYPGETITKTRSETIIHIF